MSQHQDRPSGTFQLEDYRYALEAVLDGLPTDRPDGMTQREVNNLYFLLKELRYRVEAILDCVMHEK